MSSRSEGERSDPRRILHSSVDRRRFQAVNELVKPGEEERKERINGSTSDWFDIREFRRKNHYSVFLFPSSFPIFSFFPAVIHSWRKENYFPPSFDPRENEILSSVSNP